jgi:hypothetical protein
VDESGFGWMAAVLAAGPLWYGVSSLSVAVFYAQHGLLNFPALIIGSIEVWVGGTIGLAAGELFQSPPALPDRSMLVAWTGTVCLVALGIVLTRRTEPDPNLDDEAQRVGKRAILPMALGAVVALVVIGFYTKL